MKKKLLVAAVVGAVAAPGASLAAIDDAGMKYISASEGLQGSIRIRIIDDTDEKDRGVQTAYSSSRLIYVGDADLGGGMAATYLFEFRPDGGNGSTVNTENVDAGLRGPFGWIRAGRIETFSSAFLPSADLTADVGSTGEKLAGDYDNGIRYQSPDINGLMLGFSTMMEDNDGDDDTIDQFDIGATYTLPQGIKLGASYVKVAATPAQDEDDEYGDTDGFRLGVSYGQDNWSVAYNFHSYDGNNPDEVADSVTNFFADTGTPCAGAVCTPAELGAGFASLGNGVADTGEVSIFDVTTQPSATNINAAAARVFDLEGHEDTEFTQHVVGANVQLGKIGLAVNYGTSNLSNDSYDTEPFTDAGAPETDVQKLDYDSDFFAFDAAYSLGSKARLIAAFKSVDNDEHPVTGVDSDEDSYYLLYRVDF